MEEDEVSGNTNVAAKPKYLQVALVADENVEAKHGNQTTNFLLVLANMVSFPSRNQVLVSDRLFSININLSTSVLSQMLQFYWLRYSLSIP